MNKQKLIIAILVIAALLAIVSIVFSLSVSDFKVIFVQGQQKYNDSPSGKVQIGVLPYQGAEDIP